MCGRARPDAWPRAATLLVYIDADCRAPRTWLARIEHRFERRPHLVALSGPYRFYDWDWWGRTLVRAYDVTLAPLTQVVVYHLLGLGTLFYGGNFAVASRGAVGHRRLRHRDRVPRRRHQRRASSGGVSGPVAMAGECWLLTSARRYRAMGKGQVFRLYVRNFWSEIIHHRPKDVQHQDVRI